MSWRLRTLKEARLATNDEMRGNTARSFGFCASSILPFREIPPIHWNRPRSTGTNEGFMAGPTKGGGKKRPRSIPSSKQAADRMKESTHPLSEWPTRCARGRVLAVAGSLSRSAMGCLFQSGAVHADKEREQRIEANDVIHERIQPMTSIS